MRWLALLALAFVVTLGIVIGVRASTEGRAFALGLVCGVVVSVPASLLAFLLTQRGPQPADSAGSAYPPVVILGGPGPQRPLPPPDFPPRGAKGGSEPRPPYKVIGEE